MRIAYPTLGWFALPIIVIALYNPHNFSVILALVYSVVEFIQKIKKKKKKKNCEKIT